MNPETQAELEMALAADARAASCCLHAAGRAARDGRQEAAEVLRSIASRLQAQCLGHLDALSYDETPALAAARLNYYAERARRHGDEEAAEWLETSARANRVHAERIAEVNP